MLPSALAGASSKRRLFYIPVKVKFGLAALLATSWVCFSTWFSQPWYHDLAAVVGWPLALYLIGFIAIIPGGINAFLISALLLDRRPVACMPERYPPVTVLLPAYNEEASIQDTLTSLLAQDYPGDLRIIVVNDGSKDGTAGVVRALQPGHPQLELIDLEHNGGKAAALNTALAVCRSDLVITVDADCWVRRNAVTHLVARYLSDPPGTKAVAGAILVRNSRQNLVTKAQEWDYFLGIAASKRIQSLFHGTLVAQGAFSLYDRATLESVGGWPNTVGEDIVVTWKILDAGHRVGHSEDALVFTHAPTSLRQFVRQRQRWSRGLIEAFKAAPRLMFRRRLTTLYIWWNTLFPAMDVAYTLGFIPGLVLACFGIFWIVGPMTLFLLPLALILNNVMYRIGKAMFEGENLVVRRNSLGFIVYMLFYSLVLQPACVWGYISEVLNLRKNWGTK